MTIAGGTGLNVGEVIDQIQAASPGVASDTNSARVYDVTLTTAVAGVNRLLVVNNNTAAITIDDAFINLTGITGALHAADFSYGTLI